MSSPAQPSPTAPDGSDIRVLRARTSLPWRVREVFRRRWMLRQLVRKELKVKYKGSTLGFFWSLMNPALYLAVYYVVFQIILGSAIPLFPIFLLSGLLVWNLFSISLIQGTGSIVNNSTLVNKVWFPREILPLANIGATLVHFFLQLLVLAGALVILRYPVAWEYLPLAVAALVVLLIFLSALSILLSAVNVYLRDTSHLLELVILVWFWMTPIVYPYLLVAEKLGQWSPLYLANPMTPVVLTFQRAIYNPPNRLAENAAILPPDAGYLWYARNLGMVGVGSVVLLVVALRIFGRLEGNFAEEL